MIAAKSRRFIFDASVVLKWYLKEHDSPKARRWYELIKKGSVLAISSEYLLFECANVLLNRHKLKVEDVVAILNDLSQLGFELIPLSALRANNIVLLAQEYHLTVYDAIYLELARLTDFKLITSDKSLLKIKQYTRKP